MTRSPDVPSAVLVYGAGGMGQRTVRALRAAGVEVPAVLDRHARAGQSIEGVPVFRSAEWRSAAKSLAEQALPVVIALHNPVHPVAQTQADLKGQGFGRVYTLVDVCRWFPDALPHSYWLNDPGVYAGYGEQLDAVERLLADETSRALLRSVVALRSRGEYAALPAPEPHQYFPPSLPRWPEPLRLIDCGAYDGDTLLEAQAQGYAVEQAVCLEPDPQNFSALVRAARQANIAAACLPCAVASRAVMLHFEADGAASSHLREEGGLLVQAIGLDQSFAAFAPNLIKMDIEGAEPEALEGAEQLIRSSESGLAISVYHHFSHLWSIPGLIHRWLPGHSFHLRVHAWNSFDVVLYARHPHG